ncbi:MAG: molybdopterin-binding protein [Sphingobacteriales bacterium]|nr:MAG: molybdopterin-binding protein [Sphingobacteriales bacterium]
MKNHFSSAIITLFLILGTVSIAVAQEKGKVKISGALSKPLSLDQADLKKMPRITVIRKDKNNKEHQYSGVLLSALLSAAGASTGKELHGENLKKYVIATASDGYKVVFALAELDSDFTDNKIILADTIDNVPLETSEGPFKIVVQNDKRAARCMRQVVSLKIAIAK